MSKASVQRTTRSKEKHGSTHEYSIQAVVTFCKWKGQTDAMLGCLPGCLTTLHGLRRKQIKCRIAPSIYGRVSYSIATYSDIPQPLRPVICSCWVRVQSASMKLRANIYHERNHPKPTQCTRLSLNFCFSITLNQQSYYRRKTFPASYLMAIHYQTAGAAPCMQHEQLHKPLSNNSDPSFDLKH